jgi:catechol 2,3-dioxygenase-like lactoylglutathione lyase family enzyme
MLIKAVDTVMLFVEDIDAQLAWYQATLELPLRFRHGDWAVFDVGPIQLAMHGGAEFGARVSTQRAIVSLEVDDYAAAKQTLEGRGVAFHFENETPNARFGTFRDPEGTEIQISQRLNTP